MFRYLFQLDFGGRGHRGGGRRAGSCSCGGEPAGAEVVTDRSCDRFGSEDEDLCVHKKSQKLWCAPRKRGCTGRTVDAGLLDSLEDPVDHLLAGDGEEGLGLGMAGLGLDLCILLLLRTVELTPSCGERFAGRFDEREEVDAEAARDDAAELRFRELVRQQRVREHRHPGQGRAQQGRALAVRCGRRRGQKQERGSVLDSLSRLGGCSCVRVMATTTTTTEQQLARLQAALAQVHRTRAALPALVAAVLTPSANAAPAAVQYRTAAQECHAAIRSLADQLESVQPVLDDAEKSASRDPADIVSRLPPPPPQKHPKQDRATWAHVGDILTGGLHTAGLAPAATVTRPFEPQHPVPANPADIDALVRAITDRYPRVRIDVHRARGPAAAQDGPVRRLDLTLRGLLRARISLRWERDSHHKDDDDDDTGQDGRYEADYVACYSLKEEVRSRTSFQSRGLPETDETHVSARV